MQMTSHLSLLNRYCFDFNLVVCWRHVCRKWSQAVVVMLSINHCRRSQLIMTLLKLLSPFGSLANIAKKKREFNIGYEVSRDQ